MSSVATIRNAGIEQMLNDLPGDFGLLAHAKAELHKNYLSYMDTMDILLSESWANDRERGSAYFDADNNFCDSHDLFTFAHGSGLKPHYAVRQSVIADEGASARAQ